MITRRKKAFSMGAAMGAVMMMALMPGGLVSPQEASASAVSVDDFTTLQTEIANYATATDDMTIIVTNSFDLTTWLTIPANPNGKTLTIKSDSTRRTLTGNEFIINANARLTLENIVLDGNNTADAVTLNGGGVLNMENNTILRRFSEDCAVLIRNNGTFNMNGGTIENALMGVVILSGGIFNMNGGSITSGIMASVLVNGGGTFRVGGNANVPFVMLQNNAYITFGTGENAPTSGMNIGVSKSASNNGGVFVESGATAEIAGYFTSVDSTRCAVLDNGALSLRVHTPSSADCTKCQCGATIAGANHDFNSGIWGWAEKQQRCLYCTRHGGPMDVTPPTAQVQYRTHPLANFGNTSNTFNRFFKDNLTITIIADDNLSGVKSVEYAKFANWPSPLPDDWQPYTAPLTVSSREAFFLFVKVTDNAGNFALFHDGIVVYNDVTPNGTNVSEFSHTSGDTDGKTANIALNGNTVESVVRVGSGTVSSAGNYNIVSNGITFTPAYLNSLDLGKHTFTVSYKPMDVAYVAGTGGINEAPLTTTIEITILTDISGATVTYPPLTYTGSAQSPSFTVSIGSTTLTQGTDYTVTATSQTNAGSNFAYTITGIGAYAGEKTDTWAIGKAPTGLTAIGGLGINVLASDLTAKTYNLDNIVLSPTNHGTRSYALGTFTDVGGAGVLDGTPSLGGTVLTYTGAGKSSGTATQTVTITTNNYNNITATITFTATTCVHPAFTQWVNTATCVSGGTRTRSCTSCGHEESEPVSALGHNWGSWSTTTASTCLSAGQEARTCSRCSQTQSQSVSALGHSLGVVEPTVPATCLTAGEGVQSCTRPNCSHAVTVVIPAPGHSLSGWAANPPATCLLPGANTRSCTRPGCTYSDRQTLVALGHSIGAWVVSPATCQLPGHTTRSCSRTGCTHSETQDPTPALGHILGSWSTPTAASCELPGHSTRNCSRPSCGHLEIQTVTSALGHTLGSWEAVTSPACVLPGQNRRACTRPSCTHSETQSVAALGHTFGSSTTTVPATCLLPGESRRTCTRSSCGHIDISAISALGHSWGQWVVTVQPTRTSEGVRVRRCQRDPSHTEAEILGALTSISVGDQVVPGDVIDGAVVAPSGPISSNLTAGPNPVDRSSGEIAFFWQGRVVEGGVLVVYDVLGNVVTTIKITDSDRRIIGTWDLKDNKGHQVSEGTYLVRGVIRGRDGTVERVSIVVGVR